MKEKKKKNNEVKQYEITMYKLLVIFVIALFVCIGFGFAFGHLVGRTQGIENLNINAPDYCGVYQRGDNIRIYCNEVNITAEELCAMVSTPLAQKIKVVIATT